MNFARYRYPQTLYEEFLCIEVGICTHKKVQVEDFILLFAVVCLCAATGLGYATLTPQYALLQLVLHGYEDDVAFELLGEIPRISK